MCISGVYAYTRGAHSRASLRAFTHERLRDEQQASADDANQLLLSSPVRLVSGEYEFANVCVPVCACVYVC